MAQTVNIIPTPLPAFVDFNPPENTQSFSSPSDMRWTYVYTNTLSSTTNFSFYSANRATAGADNMKKDQFTINGQWFLVNESSHCKVIKNLLTS